MTCSMLSAIIATTEVMNRMRNPGCRMAANEGLAGAGAAGLGVGIGIVFTFEAFCVSSPGLSRRPRLSGTERNNRGGRDVSAFYARLRRAMPDHDKPLYAVRSEFPFSLFA